MSYYFPINAARRNAVWTYPRAVSPRFPGAPEIAEITKSHEPPDVISLPSGADVSVEFYGGVYSFWLVGDRCRVYVGRFEYASFKSEEEARYAFAQLWREVEGLESPREVEKTAGRWLERVSGQGRT